MTGIYLRCDSCAATLGGEEVTRPARGIPAFGRGDGDKLRKLAAERGWQHTPSDYDKCPSCGRMLYANGAQVADA